MTVGSLFAGIGGFDLGFQRAGFEVRWQVEIDPWARAVLAKHWPNVCRVEDVRNAGAHNLERVDVICGGFPCQDISLAGKGAGIEGQRSGLWAEYARIIRELRPRYVVVENVAALRTRGLDRVLGDLAACGYDAEWDCIPASAVGAPHRRDRLWLVAYPNDTQWGRQQPGREAVRGDSQLAGDGKNGDVAYPARGGQPEYGHELRPSGSGTGTGQLASGGQATPPAGNMGHPHRERQHHDDDNLRGPERSRQAASAGALHTDDAVGDPHDADGVGIGLEGLIFTGPAARPVDRSSLRRDSGWWEVEPPVGRVVDGLPQRVDRLRGLGNAIVPQIAEWIARRILAAEGVTHA